jgi:oligoribonuclease
MLGIFLDQETTGLDSQKHRVLELAFKVVNLATGRELATFDEIVAQPKEVWDKRDLSAIQVNGFNWEEVSAGKNEREVADHAEKLLQQVGITRGKAVFICQNPSFDRAFFSHFIDVYRQEKLYWPYHWLDLASMFWALDLKKCKELNIDPPDETRLSKDAIAASYKLPPEARPHRAMQGVEHLLLCYQNVVGFPKEGKVNG